MKKGWFEIEGVQAGDRTVAEQLQGLASALDRAPGRSVLDMGCAEGAIACEFVRAGARPVLGYDYNAAFIDVARQQAQRLPDRGNESVGFIHADLTRLIRGGHAAHELQTFDIVLALAVCHKLPDPLAGVRYAARRCRELLVIRYTPHAADKFLMRAKQAPYNEGDFKAALEAEGLRLEQIANGPRAELVYYWTR